VEKHDFAKAETAFQRALKGQPNNFSVIYGLGFAQLMQGEQDQAITNLEHAVRLNATNSDAQQALGQAYQAKGEAEKANAALHKADELRKAGH
jgi:Flp pilus assembly protein TadD